MAEDKYYTYKRNDVQQLLPERLGRVLDVGCAQGVLGAACRERGADTVTGIELTPENAAIAEKTLDCVLCGDIETMELPFEPGAFDTIICADVLEHLRDPWAMLRRLAGLLAPGGALVASVPNIAHYSVVLKLLTGNWTYEQQGLLDLTHLRFFGPGSLGDLFQGCGLGVEQVAFTMNDEDRHFFERADASKIISAVKSMYESLRPDVNTSPLDQLDTGFFFIYQFIVRAVRRDD